MRENLYLANFHSKIFSFERIGVRGNIYFREEKWERKYDGIKESFFLAPIGVEKMMGEALERIKHLHLPHPVEVYLLLPQCFFLTHPTLLIEEVGGVVEEKTIKDMKTNSLQPPENFVKLTDIYGGFQVDNFPFVKNAVGRQANKLRMRVSYVAFSVILADFFTQVSQLNKVRFRFIPACFPILHYLEEMGASEGVLFLTDEKYSDAVYFENAFPLAYRFSFFGSYLLEKCDGKYAQINLSIEKDVKYRYKEENEIVEKFLKLLIQTVIDIYGALGVPKDRPLFLAGSPVFFVHGFCERFRDETGISAYLCCPFYSVWENSEDVTTVAFIKEMIKQGGSKKCPI